MRLCLRSTAAQFNPEKTPLAIKLIDMDARASVALWPRVSPWKAPARSDDKLSFPLSSRSSDTVKLPNVRGTRLVRALCVKFATRTRRPANAMVPITRMPSPERSRTALLLLVSRSDSPSNANACTTWTGDPRKSTASTVPTCKHEKARDGMIRRFSFCRASSVPSSVVLHWEPSQNMRFNDVSRGLRRSKREPPMNALLNAPVSMAVRNAHSSTARSLAIATPLNACTDTEVIKFRLSSTDPPACNPWNAELSIKASPAWDKSSDPRSTSPRKARDGIPVVRLDPERSKPVQRSPSNANGSMTRTPRFDKSSVAAGFRDSNEKA